MTDVLDGRLADGDSLAYGHDSQTVEKRRWVEEVLGAVRRDAPDRYEWLTGQLAHAHEPSFRRRLNRLVQDAKMPLRALLANREARKHFCERVVTSRNHYVHLDSPSEDEDDKPAEGPELLWLSRKLSYLIVACLLRDLEFEHEQAAELLERNNDYRFMYGSA